MVHVHVTDVKTGTVLVVDTTIHKLFQLTLVVTILYVLLVFIGAGVFAVAVVRQSQGHDWLMDQVQLLWQPLFAPAISLLIMAALVSGIFSWWQRRVLKPDRGSGS